MKTMLAIVRCLDFILSTVENLWSSFGVKRDRLICSLASFLRKILFFLSLQFNAYLVSYRATIL